MSDKAAKKSGLTNLYFKNEQDFYKFIGIPIMSTNEILVKNMAQTITLQQDLVKGQETEKENKRGKRESIYIDFFWNFLIFPDTLSNGYGEMRAELELAAFSNTNCTWANYTWALVNQQTQRTQQTPVQENGDEFEQCCKKMLYFSGLNKQGSSMEMDEQPPMEEPMEWADPEKAIFDPEAFTKASSLTKVVLIPKHNLINFNIPS